MVDRYLWAMSTSSFLPTPLQSPFSKHATSPLFKWEDALGGSSSIKAGRAGRDPITVDRARSRVSLGG